MAGTPLPLGSGGTIRHGSNRHDRIRHGPIPILVSFFLAVSLSLVAMPAPAEPGFDWGWNRSRPTGAELLENHFRYHAQDPGDPSLSDKLIEAYREHVAPKQGPRCPCLPSCSVYTQYAIAKCGFLRGFIMAVERMYIRENLDMVSRAHYMSVVNAKGEVKLYDPPEANDIFTNHDWRVIHPRYDLYRIEHQHSQHEAADRRGFPSPWRHPPAKGR
ncbi:MAG: membrane protein insertion efficiency factor YidD [Candidatus Eisenbacteria bacterium]|nr:membrane protein insertion efficiency factor YidD [Candidatus Eisenbacteria bacterium]